LARAGHFEREVLKAQVRLQRWGLSERYPRLRSSLAFGPPRLWETFRT
jgi:hypothetical protein